jgi:hypothetical protein
MELSKQVCSLELAKKLKSLGVKQESYRYWYEYQDHVIMGTQWCIVDPTGNFDEEDQGRFISAFTVAELGNLIPGNIDGSIFMTQKGMLGNLWYCTMKCHNLDGDGLLTEHQENADTEADARGRMMVYLLEKKLIPTAS